MKCPRCGGELRRSQKDESYGLCDNCRKKYKWVDDKEDVEDSYEDDAEYEEKQTSILEKVEQSAVDAWQNRIKVSSKISAVKISEEQKKFQIKGTIPKNGKKSGIIGKSVKGIMAVSTLGLSLAVSGGKSVGKNVWFDFDQLLNYELIMDDSTVTTGGVGMALIGGLAFGGAGLIAGGITGKRKTKKTIENMMIKVTINDFNLPCIVIPLITKTTRVDSKEYRNALEEANKILSAFDVITHNK